MTTSRQDAAPQSGALILIVLTHVFVLPVAGAFLPAEALRLGTGYGLDAGTSYTLLGGFFVLLVLALHGVAFRAARKRGERRLANGILVLFFLSLASLALIGFPSPVVGLVHLAGLLL